MVQGLSSSSVERFSVVQYHPNWFWEPPSLLFIRCWGSYLEVKLPVVEAGHSPPPSAEVKNEWSFDTTPPVCLHGVERGNLPFLTFTYEFASQTVWMFLLLELFYFIPCIFSWIISLLVLNFIQCFINILYKFVAFNNLLYLLKTSLINSVSVLIVEFKYWYCYCYRLFVYVRNSKGPSLKLMELHA